MTVKYDHVIAKLLAGFDFSECEDVDVNVCCVMENCPGYTYYEKYGYGPAGDKFSLSESEWLAAIDEFAQKEKEQDGNIVSEARTVYVRFTYKDKLGIVRKYHIEATELDKVDVFNRMLIGADGSYRLDEVYLTSEESAGIKDAESVARIFAEIPSDRRHHIKWRVPAILVAWNAHCDYLEDEYGF